MVQDDAAKRVEVRRRPFGVVGAITPWNFPVMIACWKIAPALLAGNTVVLKPSPFTPLSTLALGEVLRGVLPPGVLNVVSGGDALGAWITHAPGGAQGLLHRLGRDGQEGGRRRGAAISSASRSSSAATIPRSCWPTSTRRRSPSALFWGAFANSGQVCSAVKRVYVHEDDADAAARGARAARARA